VLLTRRANRIVLRDQDLRPALFLMAIIIIGGAFALIAAAISGPGWHILPLLSFVLFWIFGLYQSPVSHVDFNIAKKCVVIRRRGLFRRSRHVYSLQDIRLIHIVQVIGGEGELFDEIRLKLIRGREVPLSLAVYPKDVLVGILEELSAHIPLGDNRVGENRSDGV
jgi:hypothetical protein